MHKESNTIDENEMKVSEPLSVYGNAMTMNAFMPNNHSRMTVDEYFDKLWSTVERRYEAL